jgi:hypothetical protein
MNLHVLIAINNQEKQTGNLGYATQEEEKH